ncbi:hypothetical protein L1987_70199 [Smallanthus sonchifolius]|uniref:Uncharacterized protein n=1 Tax=Smallanthus sonchifolius TaxID=185202 RepID=A0ACB9APU5_9ASTR|nr:hypothetical protein L1987_70199 [Smallanthus sonchifolius]
MGATNMVMAYNSTKAYIDLVNEVKGTYNISGHFLLSLLDYVKTIYRADLENRYSEPMLWIGMYIALASVCCVLAMVADLVHGVRSRKLWFPCKYFSINAASLTVISIAMKLPVDLSGSMPGDVDQVAKLGSMAFMCTMMAHLLPSLATMDNNELLTNIIALCVQVVTLVVNVCIQIQTGVISNGEDMGDTLTLDHRDYKHFKLVDITEIPNATLATIYVTLLMVLLMIYVCSSLPILLSKQIKESKFKEEDETISKEVKESLLTVEKLKQHLRNYWIMAGSENPQFVIACSATITAAGVICISTTILHTLTMCWTVAGILGKDYDSDYKWSTLPIIIIQFVGVVLGTIVPLYRCFGSFGFKWLLKKYITYRERTEENLEGIQYVFRFQEEMDLYDGTLEVLLKSWNKLFREGQKQQPRNLNQLILRNTTPRFQGVQKFSKVEHGDCWSLMVVTLTTIAVTLPMIEKVETDCLLNNVREGLEYVALVEKNLNASNDYLIIQNAAEWLWQEVDVRHKWLGIRLKDIASQVNCQEDTTLQIVQLFTEKARNKIRDEEARINIDGDSKFTFICAESMYRITETIVTNDIGNHKELFAQLISWIADITAACLTNLPQVIAMKCHTHLIEKREACVQAATQLLGETNDIINILQDHDLTIMNPDDLPFLDKWRAYLSDP